MTRILTIVNLLLVVALVAGSVVAWPDLPVVPIIAILLSATAALTAPPSPMPVTRRRLRPVEGAEDRSTGPAEAVAA